MNVLELILVSIGVSLDAFAVSICKGISLKKLTLNNILKVGLYFSIFQGLMPVFGYYIGINFHDLIKSIDHYIVFIILLILGIKMMKESYDNETYDDKLDIKTMLILSIATSIDALALGISFSLLEVNIFNTVIIIMIMTFMSSSIGIIIGNKFKNKHGNKTLVLGGLILIFIGTKVLIEHLFF